MHARSLQCRRYDWCSGARSMIAALRSRFEGATLFASIDGATNSAARLGSGLWHARRKRARMGRQPMNDHRILVVEDDDSNREFLRALLEGEGFLVATARNGLEALVWLTPSAQTF